MARAICRQVALALLLSRIADVLAAGNTAHFPSPGHPAGVPPCTFHSCCGCSRGGLQHTTSSLPGGLGAGDSRAERLRGGGDHVETVARASTAPAEAPTAPADADSAALSVVSASAGEGCAGEGDDGVRSSSSSSSRLTADGPETEEGRGDLAPSVRSATTKGGGDGNHSEGVAHGAELAAAVDLDSFLVLAASEGDMEQVQELLRKGASVNALYIPQLQAGVKPSGCTPLHAGAHSQFFSLWLLHRKYTRALTFENVREPKTAVPQYEYSLHWLYIGNILDH